MLFQILVAVSVVFYVAFYFKVVRRYFDEHGLDLNMTWRQTGGTVKLVPRPFRLLIFVGCFLIAPLLARRLRREDFEEEQRRIQESQKRLMQEYAEQKRINAERKTLREEWLKNNPITLYYNTVSGITVVMTPAMYNANLVSTKWHRRNAMWDKNVLMPYPEAFLFVDANGRDLFISNSGSATTDLIKYNYVNGWLTDLDELVERYGITLEQKPEIFVPYVNTSVLPFHEHKFDRNFGHYEYGLVINQTPPEMQPI
jgi:hypothetical protein